MKNKQSSQWIIGLVLVIVAVIALGIWGFDRNKNNPTAAGPKTADSVNLEDQSYYDDNANVMEFYQDSCSWCIKEQAILSELGAQGYRVRPMNIGPNHPDNQSWWEQYKISGTPTFLDKNGDRLEGYQTTDKLKAFLDAHK